MRDDGKARNDGDDDQDDLLDVLGDRDVIDDPDHGHDDLDYNHDDLDNDLDFYPHVYRDCSGNLFP